jgi:hypothetical protein
MLEADFEKGTITFQMHGYYYARAGNYIILPMEEYDQIKRNQKEPVEIMEQFYRDRSNA